MIYGLAHRLKRGDTMQYTVVGPDETPEMLSARLNVPLCMLLRANRLFSTQWLFPGRQIAVPDRAFCRRDAGVCPADALRIPSERLICGNPSAHLPERLRQWSRTHAGLMPEQWQHPGKTVVLRPGESFAAAARRAGCDEETLRRMNRHFARPVPGTVLWLPVQNESERV